MSKSGLWLCNACRYWHEWGYEVVHPEDKNLFGTCEHYSHKIPADYRCWRWLGRKPVNTDDVLTDLKSWLADETDPFLSVPLVERAVAEIERLRELEEAHPAQEVEDKVFAGLWEEGKEHT